MCRTATYCRCASVASVRKKKGSVKPKAFRVYAIVCEKSEYTKISHDDWWTVNVAWHISTFVTCSFCRLRSFTFFDRSPNPRPIVWCMPKICVIGLCVCVCQRWRRSVHKFTHLRSRHNTKSEITHLFANGKVGHHEGACLYFYVSEYVRWNVRRTRNRSIAKIIFDTLIDSNWSRCYKNHFESNKHSSTTRPDLILFSYSPARECRQVSLETRAWRLRVYYVLCRMSGSMLVAPLLEKGNQRNVCRVCELAPRDRRSQQQQPGSQQHQPN